jgi:calcineurin-like phosphoesterase
VLGIHTHDPTARCHLLPGGTAFVAAEVGMTGRLGWTGGGFDPAHFTANLKGDEVRRVPAYGLASGPMVLGAVLLRLEGKRATTVQRIA